MPGSFVHGGRWTSCPCASTNVTALKFNLGLELTARAPQENREPLGSKACVGKDHDLAGAVGAHIPCPPLGIGIGKLH